MTKFRPHLTTLALFLSAYSFAGTWSISRGTNTVGTNTTIFAGSTGFSGSGNDFTASVSSSAYALGPGGGTAKYSGHVTYTITWTPSFTGETPPTEIIASGSTAVVAVTLSGKALYNMEAYDDDPDDELARLTGSTRAYFFATANGSPVEKTYTAAMVANSPNPSIGSSDGTNNSWVTEYFNGFQQANLTLGAGGVWSGTFQAFYYVESDSDALGDSGNASSSGAITLRPTLLGTHRIAPDL